jgi:DNA-directed RNA polymerase subunit K/omega
LHFLDYQNFAMTTLTNHQKLLAIALEEARSGLVQNGINVIDLNSTEGIAI